MNILMVLTSHDRFGNTGRKTGFWLEEFVAHYYVFKGAGAKLTLASPLGGLPPIGPKSDAAASQTDATRRFKSDKGRAIGAGRYGEAVDAESDRLRRRVLSRRPWPAMGPGRRCRVDCADRRRQAGRGRVPRGSPSFFLNGKVVDVSFGLEHLEHAVRAAL